MDEYYLFSFISNKLIIMHYFTNDSSNKLVVTLFTIFSLQSNFQIEDLIFKSANSEIRWFKEWQFCGYDSEQMKTNLENPEHGFCPERAQLSSHRTVCPKSACTGRHAGFFEHDFRRFAVAAALQILAAKPNTPCSCWSNGLNQSNFVKQIMIVIIYALIFLYLMKPKIRGWGDGERLFL